MKKNQYSDITLEERFWTKVEKTDKCWEWKASRNACGYGVFGRGWNEPQPSTLAHRVSAWLSGMDIEDKVVCHHCDNPGCVNPEHFFIGTPADNVRDMIAKGRNVLPPKARNNNKRRKI